MAQTKYRAIGATTNSYGADKLYWKAIFPKRDAFINNSEITINLPEYLAGKIKNYYNIGGNFKSSLLDDTIIKFYSLQSLPPGQSTIIKAIFTGNFLHLNQLAVSSTVNKKISLNTPKSIIAYLIVGCVILIFIGIFILFLFILYDVLLTNTSKNKSNNNSNNSSGCSTGGGCSAGCGSGCGGGCGGGG